MEAINNASFSSSSSRDEDRESFQSSDNDLSEGESGIFVTMALTEAIINDPLAHQVKIDSLALAVVDTPEFQRLRNIKQCGVCDLVYPSAVHTRFEHSIGVYQWADKLMSQLRQKKNDPLTRCVKLAGLCHDLGHGPFSHLWERFLGKIGIHWKHETESATIFKHIIEKNNLMNKFIAAGLDSEHIELICSLILGNREAILHLENKTGVEPFHYEVINNDETGIDVDKWDYLQRDSYFFGMKFTVDAYRVLSNMVLVGEKGQRHIAFNEKCADTILDLFEFRCKLHKKCYQHRVCKTVEIMLVDALIAAKDHVFYSSENDSRRVKLCEIHKDENVDIFLQATDSIFQTILHSTSADLKDSKEIIQRMITRDLYTFILEKTVPTALAQRFLREEKMLGDFVNSIEKTLRGTEWLVDKCGQFRTCFVRLDMGKNQDPIERVRFVRKDRTSVTVNKKAREVQPEFFQEQTVFGSLTLLVFSTKSKKLKLAADTNARIQTGIEKIVHDAFESFSLINCNNMK